MSWLSLLDVGTTTGVCVTLLILAVIILWAYVTLSQGPKIDQRDLSVTFDPSQKVNVNQSGNKKTQKSKGKKKQVDGSPRPLVSRAQNKVVSKPHVQETDSVSHHQTSSKKVESKNTKISHEGKKRSVKGKKNQDRSKNAQAQEDKVKHKEDGDANEGGWQTQLSRLQLRALKQKQRQVVVVTAELEKEGANVDQLEGIIPSEEIPSGYQPKVDSASGGDNSSPDPDPSFSTFIPTGDVEHALKEAACSQSSAEESKSTAETSTKRPRKRKKTRKKTIPVGPVTNTPVALAEDENQEEWVLI